MWFRKFIQDSPSRRRSSAQAPYNSHSISSNRPNYLQEGHNYSIGGIALIQEAGSGE